MDDDGLRNWGYYEPLKSQLNLQLMPSMAPERSTRSFLPGLDPNPMLSGNAAYHQNTNTYMDYPNWTIANQRDRFINMVPTNPSYHNYLPEPSQPRTLHMLQPPSDSLNGKYDAKDEALESNDDDYHIKKRKNNVSLKNPKTKKAQKNPSYKQPRGKTGKIINMDFVINGVDMDISGMPIPVCSCTGNPQQCYRWGCGGWQSACCTRSISMYPLPMSTKKRGTRTAGRKMSQGAFKKVLEQLVAEAYNFENPIDLKTYWAKHGTNKFVTIR